MVKPQPTTPHARARVGWSSYLLATGLGLAVVLAIAAPLWAYRHLKIDFPPMVGDDAATTTCNQPVEITVLMNDADPVGLVDPKTVTIETPPKHGTAVPNPETGKVTYIPAADFTGQDVFLYSVRNQEAVRSNLATVTVTITRQTRRIAL